MSINIILPEVDKTLISVAIEWKQTKCLW